jgi:RNA polymerase sigma-70 factor (ECF subfamily)
MVFMPRETGHAARLSGRQAPGTFFMKSSLPTVLEDLYRRHGPDIRALAYRRALNADVALDIVQEAFLRLWIQWLKGVEIINPYAWLVRVAGNLAKDFAKTAFQRYGTQPPDFMKGIPANDPPPLERLEGEETFAHLRAEVEKLSLADRELLTMRYALDYNTAQIAHALGIKPTAVHMRLNRARGRLLHRLTVQRDQAKEKPLPGKTGSGSRSMFLG